MPTYREDMHTGHKVPLVETDDIVNGAITAEKISGIPENIVSTGNIADRAVTSPKIAGGAVTNEKLANASVTTPKISEGAVTNSKIGNSAVSSRNLMDSAVTPDKLNAAVMSSLVLPAIHQFTDPINKALAELRQLIGSYNKHGVAVSNEFGTAEDIGISQKALTDALNKVWTKLEDITGEPYTGINMTISPKYFISEDNCSVHIQARTAEANGVFEKISFYVNGSLAVEAENIDYYEGDIELTETSVIKCVAKIMGIEYMREDVVTHYNSFWIGAGASYADIMDVEHVIPITEGMRGSYDITCADSDHIIIVMAKSMRPAFVRADMNSFEIPFDETTVTINNEEYSMFTSRNAYEAGTYNIDING